MAGGHPEKRPRADDQGDLAHRTQMGGDLTAEELGSLEAWIKTLSEENAIPKSGRRWATRKAR